MMSRFISVLLFPVVAIAQTLTPGPVTVQGPVNYCVDTASSGAYTCAMPRLSTYQDGTCYRMYTARANNGAATVDLGPGAKSIVRADGSTLQGDGAGGGSDDIPANHIFSFCYIQSADRFELAGITVATSGSLPYFQLFTAASTWTVAGTAHGLGPNVAVLTQAKNGTSTWDDVVPASRTINQSSADVSATWASPRTGRIMITGLSGSSQGPSSPTDHAALTNLSFAASGHTGFAPAVHATQHQNGGSDEISTGTPTANAIPKANASGRLDSWVSTMTGDSGSGGTAGKVPAPAAGDAGKCLKGDGTWGSCASGVAGVSSFGPTGAPRTGDVHPASADYNASQVTFTPQAGIAATTTDAAIVEAAADSVPLTSKNAANGVAGLDGSVKLTRSVVPVMVGDTGTGGQAGAVPAPGAGDATKCLQGSGNWGTCGGGGGSSGVDIYSGSGHTTVQTGVSKLAFIGFDSVVYNSGFGGVDITAPAGGGGGGGGAPTTCSPSGTYMCQVGDYSMAGNISVTSGNADYTMTLPNLATGGTALNKLAGWTVSAGLLYARTATTADFIGICTGNCGTSGQARIAIRGTAICNFDNSATAGQWVTATSSTGQCHASGTSRPAGTVIGLVIDNATFGVGNYKVAMMGF